MKKKKNPCIGSSFDDFLKEEGIFEESTAVAIKRVIAFQLKKEMQKKKITQSEMAKRLKTSRAALKSLLAVPDAWLPRAKADDKLTCVMFRCK